MCAAMMNLQSDEYLFAREFFSKNDYLIIGHEVKPQHIQILAKNLKNGNNETFFIRNGVMTKLCHRKTKREPWYKKEVARQNNSRNYVNQIRAAVNDQHK